MTHPQSHSLAAEDADVLAAELVEELASRLQAGEAVDLEACAREHPACADRIRRLLPAVQMLAELGRSTAGPKTGNAAADQVGGILGDFRLRREVGRGGMGVVYEAEQISLRRRVALKVLPFAAMLDPRQLQRFHNEARAAACLHHPNIVPVYAVGSERAVHFYAMQFIEGQTLASLILGLRRQAGLEGADKARPTCGARGAPAPPPTGAADLQRTITYPLPAPHQATSVAGTSVTPTATSTGRGARAPSFFRRVAQLGVQAAEALEHAHQQGVVHRDIKPANILLDLRGNLWITDFGLAQFQHEAGMTASGDLLGTLRYMSPEHARGGRRVADHRVDIYSLGVTLYEFLTLQHAFLGDDRQELIRQIITDEPRPVRRLDPAVPPDLETIVGKAMAKDPDERYLSAQELADDLKRFLEDRPIRARPPSLWQQGKKWASRNRPYVWSLGLFVALAVLASVVGLLAFGLTESHLAEKEKREREKLQQDHLELELEHFDTLLGQAEGLRLERKPGYRKRLCDDLHMAAELHVPNASPDRIRDRLLACLGDPIGLDPVVSPPVTRMARPKIPAAWSGLLDGSGLAAANPRAVSPDGRRLAYVWRQHHAMLHVVVPGKAWQPPLVGASTVGLAVSPAGQAPLLVSSGLFPGRTNEWGFWFCPLGGIYDLEFGPDNHTLVAGCEEGVAVWTLDDPLAPYVPLLLRSQFRVGNIQSVAIHPGGRLLAIAGRQLELWSLDANRRIASIGEVDQGTKVAFSQDGKLLLARLHGVEMGWPVTETPEKRLLQAQQGGVPVVDFSPDGTLLASGSKDGMARIWDVASGRVSHICRGGHVGPVTTRDFPNTVEGVAFSPDGKWLATGDFQGKVCLWDTRSGQEVAVMEDTSQLPQGKAPGPPGQVWRLRFSPSGKYLVAGGGFGIAVWKVQTAGAGVILQLVGTATSPEVLWVRDLAIHPGEEEIIFLSGQWKLYASKLEGRAAPRPLTGMEQRVGTALRGLNFDAAGDRLTYITDRGTLGLWDRRVGKSHDTDVPAYHVAVGGGGRWIATSGRLHEVIIYDVKAGRVAMTLPPEETEVWCLAWSPDGTHLAVSMTDGGIAIWDLEQVRHRLAEFGVAVPSTKFPSGP